MGSFRRKSLAGGLALALVAAGCSKTPAPVAQSAPVPTVAEAPAPKVDEPKPEAPAVEVEPPPDPGPRPSILPPIPSPLMPVIAPPKPEPIPVPEAVAQVPPPKPEPQPAKADPPKPADPVEPPKGPQKVVYPTVVDGKDLTTWLKQLNWVAQPDPQQREFALKSLPQFGPEARKPAIKPIAEIIYNDPDPGVRIVAISIISNMGFDIRDQIAPAVNALVTCMRNTGPASIVRLYCVRSLMSFGTDAASAIPEIRQAGTDPSWETRMAVATALGRVGGPPGGDKDKDKPSDAASKYLLNFLLKDVCAGVRMEAIQALLQIGPPRPKTPEEYIKDIKLYLEPVEARLKAEKDKGVLCWLYLLNIMYDDRVLPEHLKKIASYIKFPDSPMVRMHAINACAALGAKAAPVIPQLKDALSYDEAALVIAALSALAQIGPEARGVLPELEEIKAGSKDPVKPPDAPKDWKPDTTLRLVAADAILYVTGKKKLGDPEPKK